MALLLYKANYSDNACTRANAADEPFWGQMEPAPGVATNLTTLEGAERCLNQSTTSAEVWRSLNRRTRAG